jgi:hypothetical protein
MQVRGSRAESGIGNKTFIKVRFVFLIPGFGCTNAFSINYL